MKARGSPASTRPPLARLLVLLSAGAAMVVSPEHAAADGQSALDPASRASGDIANLWWIMLTAAWVVFGVVLVLVAIAIARRREMAGGSDRRARMLILTGGFFVPVVVLSILLALSIRTLPATSAPKQRSTALTVRVVGRQFFWDVSYPDTSGAVTANEIHIPARTRVRLVAETDDVIHSFWVPQLNRKIDMVPGRVNEIVLQADRPGVYRGQCAEYCGLQHAHMAFLVFADPPAQFRKWLLRQAAPAAYPTDAHVRRGVAAFDDYGCGACHTIRGTDASGDVGPDLTHVASRTTLGAVAIPNSEGFLGAWILDPQHVKPGSKMPGVDVPGRDFQALLAYLESLR